VTLTEAAQGCFEAKKAELKNATAVKRWLGLLENHVLPKIGDIPVEDIDQHMIKKTLEPLWHRKAETARKSLGHIGQTLKYAAALGLEVDLQATMKARALLGKQKHKTEHIPAMPYADAPKFYGWLCEQNHTAALALRLLVGIFAAINANVWKIHLGHWPTLLSAISMCTNLKIRCGR